MSLFVEIVDNRTNNKLVNAILQQQNEDELIDEVCKSKIVSLGSF